jgi:hypothetical protein
MIRVYNIRNDSAPADGLPGVDLCGRRVLFVGGLHRCKAQLRRLVERHNGRFAHHDGGSEESLERLGALLHRADVVLFPTEIVSHAAQYKVKRHCQRWDKPYVPLFRFGVDAVVTALQAITRT